MPKKSTQQSKVVEATIVQGDDTASSTSVQVIEVDAQNIDSAQSSIQPVVDPFSSISPATLKQQLEDYAKRREVIKEFVSSQLKEKVDYGKSVDKVGAKDTLLKPGMEKIISLFQLTTLIVRDDETWEMFNRQEGLVCFRCDVYFRGQKIAEGRGACDSRAVSSKGNNLHNENSAIKIAEKRARMDACLSLGFSEYFTQDMEDPEYRDMDMANRENSNAPKKDLGGWAKPNPQTHQQAQVSPKPAQSYVPKPSTRPVTPTTFVADVLDEDHIIREIEVTNVAFRVAENENEYAKLTLSNGESILAFAPTHTQFNRGAGFYRVTLRKTTDKNDNLRLVVADSKSEFLGRIQE